MFDSCERGIALKSGISYLKLSDCGLFATMDSVHFIHEFAFYFVLVSCFFLFGLR